MEAEAQRKIAIDLAYENQAEDNTREELRLNMTELRKSLGFKHPEELDTVYEEV